MRSFRWRTWFAGLVALIVALPTLAGCSLPVASATASQKSQSAPATTEPPVTETSSLGATRPMLPLGTAHDFNQPYQPCSPALLPAIPMQGPSFWQAFQMDDLQAQMEPSARSDIVSYNVGGSKPLDADSLHVTVPPVRATLRTSPGTRLFVDGGGEACITEWRVSARELAGFDGQQESGTTWQKLGAGKGQSDAVVVGGVSAGEWIIHIHLAFGPDSAAKRDTTDSYARVVAGGSSPRGVDVPRPVLVAPCGDTLTPLTTTPDMVLSTDGVTWTSGEVARGTNHTGPGKMPGPVLPVAAGSLIRVRTADGRCGNDWGGAIFSVVPDDLAAAFGGAGLDYNNGGDPNSPTPPPVGGLNAIPPAAGEWLFSVVFFFGDSGVATYYWRISVR